MLVGPRVVAALLAASTHAAPSAAHGAAPETCDALLQKVEASLSAERRRQLEGASDADGPATEFEPAIRACYRDRVVPALKRAEMDDAQIPAAFSALFGWGRDAQLRGFSEADFTAEWDAAYASLTKAFTSGYSRALARCKARPDPAAAKRLTELYAGSSPLPVSGDALFPEFRRDLATCRRATGYLITVVDRVVEEKLGTTKEMRYTATVTPSAADPAEYTGTGSYGGFVVATPNCVDGKFVNAPIKLPVGGRLDATATAADMSMLGGSKNSFQFVLASLDWPYKPFFFSGRDAVATGEDREGVAGLGTTASPFFALTGPVTVTRESESTDGGRCLGKVTTTSEIRVERLGAR